MGQQIIDGLAHIRIEVDGIDNGDIDRIGLGYLLEGLADLEETIPEIFAPVAGD